MNYALGAAAARTSKTGKLGFIGAFPIPSIMLSAIAFHLGAQSVNPKATTRVIWLNSWSDPAAEASAVNTLHANHVDVVSDLIDSPVTILETANAHHMYAAGYHSAAGSEFAGNYWLSACAFNWGPMFTQMAKDVIAKTWKGSRYDANYVAPVQTRAAYLAPWGPKITTLAKKAGNAAFTAFLTNKMHSAFGTDLQPEGQA